MLLIANYYHLRIAIFNGVITWQAITNISTFYGISCMETLTGKTRASNTGIEKG